MRKGCDACLAEHSAHKGIGINGETEGSCRHCVGGSWSELATASSCSLAKTSSLGPPLAMDARTTAS